MCEVCQDSALQKQEDNLLVPEPLSEPLIRVLVVQNTFFNCFEWLGNWQIALLFFVLLLVIMMQMWYRQFYTFWFI